MDLHSLLSHLGPKVLHGDNWLTEDLNSQLKTRKWNPPGSYG